MSDDLDDGQTEGTTGPTRRTTLLVIGATILGLDLLTKILDRKSVV